jgi:hypothetical protein
LIQTDQNWGKASITLIDQFADNNYQKNKTHKAFHKNKKAPDNSVFSKAGSESEGAESSAAPEFKAHKLSIPPNAIIINTGDNLTSGGLIPIAYKTAEVPVNSDDQANGGTKDTGSGTENHPPIVIQVSAARSNLILFNQDKQVSLGDISRNDQTFLSGSKGTTFSSNNGIIYLHVGSLLLDSSSEPVKVATKLAGLKIEPGSAALFEYWPNKPIRVVALAGKGQAPVKVRVSFLPGAPIVLAPGEELLVSESQLSDEDLKATDGSERKLLDKGEGLTGGSVVKRSLPLEKFDRTLVLDSKQAQLLSAVKKNAYGRLLAHLAKDAGCSQDDLSQPDTNTIPANWSADPMRIFASDGTELMTQDNGRLTLYSGSVFLRAPSNSLVETELGAVHIDDPAVLSICYNSGALRVNTCDGPRAVWVLTGHYKILLNPGTELLLTDHAPSQSEAYAADGIGRRRVTAATLDNGLTAALSDFSVFSMLNSTPYLKPLKKPVTSTDAKIVDTVLSSAATLNITTSARGEFFTQEKQ